MCILFYSIFYSVMASIMQCLLAGKHRLFAPMKTRLFNQLARKAQHSSPFAQHYIHYASINYRRSVSAAASTVGGPSSTASSVSAGSVSAEVCSLQVTFLDVPGAVADDLGDMLLAEGATSTSVEEYRPEGAPEQKIFANDGSGEHHRVWNRCKVLAYFPAESDAAAAAAAAAEAVPLTTHRQPTVTAVRVQDWEAAIKASYTPVEVAPDLWIVPSWAQPPAPSALNLILEPGLAFGTGDHPTTRLCLRWLRLLSQPNATTGSDTPSTHAAAHKTSKTISADCDTESKATPSAAPGSIISGSRGLMDYGTGSGVLAVAALLLGAPRAVGTDVEPLAVRAAQQNAALNGVGGAFVALQCGADLAQAEPMKASGVPAEELLFDVVVANILQGPLLELAPRLAAYAAPDAVLGLSGILQTQAPAVIAAYSPWFCDFTVTTEENWALVTAVRKRKTD